MKIIWPFVIAFALALGGCVSGGPKTKLIEGKLPAEKAALVHPTGVPGGLMLIRQMDGESTYIASIGYFGSIYVPPGRHEFVVEVSHGFKVQDAGGPAWTAPAGANIAPLQAEGGVGTGLLVTRGSARVAGTVEGGKVYEIKFGFDRSVVDRPVPIVWVAEVPGR